jgi:hypothetical protein
MIKAEFSCFPDADEKRPYAVGHKKRFVLPNRRNINIWVLCHEIFQQFIVEIEIKWNMIFVRNKRALPLINEGSER